MKTLRSRVTLLLSVFCISFLLGVYNWHFNEQKRVMRLSDRAAKEQVDLLQRIIRLKQEPISLLSNDYSNWDDLVKFINHPNSIWADNNLKTALSTYNCDEIYVYNDKNKLVYFISSNKPVAASQSIAESILNNVDQHKKLNHFYLSLNHELYEFYGSKVYKTNDYEREGKSYGYFVVANILDKDYCNSLSQVTGGKVKLIDPRFGAPDIQWRTADDGTIIYTQQVYNPRGEPIKRLYFANSNQVTKTLTKSSANTVNIIAIFTFSLMAILFGVLYLWVSSPLLAIVNSMHRRDTDKLKQLEKDTTEIGQLARVIHDSYQQQDSLITEINERKKIETELQQARNSLENRVADRTRELADAYDRTIEGWSRALDLRDKETEGHSQRVTQMTIRLARKMGLSEQDIIYIRRGALLHDIGKVGIPDAILLKPGPLDDEEWIIMKRHPQLAFDLLSPIQFLQPSLDIPYCHHEKWDGTGYPRGLSGLDIPLAARLFCIVDVWDALKSDRPYRKGWSDEKIIEHVKSLSGAHFEPAVVDLFLSVMEEDINKNIFFAKAA